jgi:hypothetical protein
MAMNPRQPGGIQNLSVNAMGEIPGNPFGAAVPGAFPHNSTGVGATGLGPARPSPGQRVGPQSVPTPDITSNRGTFPSNELVSQSLTTKNWKHTNYQLKQRRGDLMFVRRETGDHPNSAAACNVAQLAEMLRDGYKKLMSQLAVDDSLSKTHMLFEGSRVSGKQKEIISLLEKYQLEGEVALTADDALRKKIQSDRILKLLMYVSLEHIRESYNKIGPYMSDGGREAQKQIVLNIGVKGPSHYQEVVNYWGNIHMNDRLFLILTRRKDLERSREDRPVYGEFHWKTWASKDAWPPEELLWYHDNAGILQKSWVIYVGSVVYTPLKWNDEPLCQILLGNTANSEEAFERSAYARKVEINLGTPKHRLDIYSV